MAHPSLITVLKDMRGNVRGCVYTEALWGIPYNLYLPYVSVYMLALGLSDAQIGLITSIGLAFQVFWALISGALTDKLGRRRTTLLADLVSWSVPCLIWAVSQDFSYFLVAAIFNSVWRVSMNSWTCLLVEDTDPALLVDVYSWIYISGLVAAFFAPAGGLFIARYSLVPTMRALYVLSFVMMTAKFFVMNAIVTETRQGQVRMAETRGQSLFDVLGGSRSVLRQIMRSPVMLGAVSLMLVLSISRMVTNTFWSILATERLLVPAQDLALFSFTRSMVQLLVYFLVMPRLRNAVMRTPLLVGFSGLVLSSAILITIPPQNYALLMAATALEALSLPTVGTMVDKLTAVVVDAKERARIMALMYVVVIVGTTPFGWIAGAASQINRTLPFALNVTLFAIGGALTYAVTQASRGRGTGMETSEQLPAA